MAKKREYTCIKVGRPILGHAKTKLKMEVKVLFVFFIQSQNFISKRD